MHLGEKPNDERNCEILPLEKWPSGGAVRSPYPQCSRYAVRLQGMHNACGVLCAVCAALASGGINTSVCMAQGDSQHYDVVIQVFRQQPQTRRWIGVQMVYANNIAGDHYRPTVMVQNNCKFLKNGNLNACWISADGGRLNPDWDQSSLWSQEFTKQSWTDFHIMSSHPSDGEVWRRADTHHDRTRSFISFEYDIHSLPES